MKNQMTTLVDFFFIQSFFDWVARVQKLMSRSKLHGRTRYREASVAVTETDTCMQRTSADNNSQEYDDIKHVMHRLGLVYEEETDDKKLMKFDNISTLFDETEPCLDEVMAAFSVFDQNSDGFIDENELSSVMSALGFKEGMGLETCRKMIRDYDMNADGLIDFNEFVKIVEMSFC